MTDTLKDALHEQEEALMLEQIPEVARVLILEIWWVY